jgi:hypothetical protein
MPPWYPAPAHWSSKQISKRTSLHYRISTLLLPIIQANASMEIAPKLGSILEALQPLESELEGQALRDQVEKVLYCCAELSSGATRQRSLELQLRAQGNELSTPARKTVAQIDKIARYCLLCKDLAKLLVKSGYRTLFQQTRLETLLSPPPTRPRGAAEQCYVHAEVQLLMHYDREPCLLPPRAIGCSKSACFLCDRLIRHHGKFKISVSHQRVYPKWTIPNLDWMSSVQLKIWRNIIRGMRVEMREMIQSYNLSEAVTLQAPIESRACLPLSSAASSANSHPSEIFHVSQTAHQGSGLSGSSYEVSVNELAPDCGAGRWLDLSNISLPFSSHLPIAYRGIRFSLDKLTIILEFDKGVLGKVSLQAVTSSPTGSRSITIEDLSCTEDAVLAPTAGEDRLGLIFRLREHAVLQVIIEWNRVP